MERASVLLAAILAGTSLAAQDQVAIEIPSGTTSPLSHVRGRLSGGNQRLLDALAFSYEIEPMRVIAPDWFRGARYDFTVVTLQAAAVRIRPRRAPALQAQVVSQPVRVQPRSAHIHLGL